MRKLPKTQFLPKKEIAKKKPKEMAKKKPKMSKNLAPWNGK